MREIYRTPEWEMVSFDSEDIICTSTSGENELPFVPAAMSVELPPS